MDPQQTLYNLLHELTQPEPDRDQVAELLESLAQWIDRGGFLPIVQPFPGRACLVTADRLQPAGPLPAKPF